MLQAVLFDEKGIIDGHLRNKLGNCGFFLSQTCQFDEKTSISVAEKKPDILLYCCSSDDCNPFDRILKLSNDIGIPCILITSKADVGFFRKLDDVRPAWYIKEPFDGDELYHIAKKAIDVNSREKSLKEKEEKHELALKLANMVPWEWDLENDIGHILSEGNPHNIGKSVFSYEELINHLYPEDRDLVARVIEDTIQNRKHCKVQYRMQDLEGKIRWLSTYCKLYNNALGKCVKMVGVTQDITEYKEAQKALEESEQKFRLLAENANDAIWTMDKNGKFLYVSPSVKKLTGYSPEEAMERSLWETLTTESFKSVIPKIEGFFEKLQNGITPEPVYIFEVEQYCKNGSMVWTEVVVNPIFDEEGVFKLFLGVTRNISEKKIAEIELKKQKKLMDNIFENAPISMLIINKERRIENINHSGIEAAQRKKEELIGLFGGEAFSCVNSFKGDGCGKNEECNQCPVCNAVMNTFMTGENFHRLEGSLKTVHDGKISTHNLLISTVRFEMRDDVKVMLSIEDITENKNAELEILETKLTAERANRIKSEFLATMSHELRTPLNAVIGYADLLLEDTYGELNHKQRKSIEHISTGGKHLLELINDILDISKIESGKMELQYDKFFVQDALLNVQYIVSPLAKKKKIQLDFHIEPDTLILHADKSRFKQILYNLISNAVKFTPDGGLVKINVYKKDSGIKADVIDTGIGIPHEQLSKLFIPFKQLDSTDSRNYEGTGLGLSLVKKFVELHGGKVEVASEVGKGSTFSFWIPAQRTDPKKKDN
ncbi:MAG: PAS domain S-box protein [Methanomethylovorans sp.]|nr:PAS domain S-box protein [Methanomethylovorans sp.]